MKCRQAIAAVSTVAASSCRRRPPGRVARSSAAPERPHPAVTAAATRGQCQPIVPASRMPAMPVKCIAAMPRPRTIPAPTVAAARRVVRASARAPQAEAVPTTSESTVSAGSYPIPKPGS